MSAELRALSPEEAVEKALLFTFQLSGKDYRKMQTALSEVAFIRALEQDGYTVALLDERDAAIRRAEELWSAADAILELIDTSAAEGDDSMPLYDVLDPDIWHPAIDTLRAALRSQESQKPPETER